MLNDADQLRKAQEQYDAIGSEYRCWRMPSDAAAGEAYARLRGRVDASGGSVSGWRFTNPDHSEAFIAVMGERAGEVARFAPLIEALGGEPYELEADHVAALRQRRRNVATEAFARGEREVDERGHYGEGAYLNRDGTMESAS